MDRGEDTESQLVKMASRSSVTNARTREVTTVQSSEVVLKKEERESKKKEQLKLPFNVKRAGCTNHHDHVTLADSGVASSSIANHTRDISAYRLQTAQRTLFQKACR